MQKIEMALIAGHELPLPAEPYLWNRRDRDREVWRRERALDDARGVHRRALWCHRLRRMLTHGLKWKCSPGRPSCVEPR